MPLASSLETLKKSRAVLDKLSDPDSFSLETVKDGISEMGPELYAFLFKQAGVVAQGSISDQLEQTINKLGFERVKRLIYFHVAYSTEAQANATELERRFNAKFWALNYRVAFMCEHWAKQLVPNKAEDLFYVGMLQNIGITAFAQLEPSKHRALRESQRQVPLAEKEREHFQVTHYELGIAIVEKWRLPKIHKSAMKFEETHGQSAGGFANEELEELFSLVYLAKYRSERKKYRIGMAIQRLGIDPYFQYDSLLLQIAKDYITDAEEKRSA